MESTGIMPTLPLGGDGFGNNGSLIFLFAILALMGGGFGGWNRGYGTPATVEDLNATSNFARQESQVRANAELIERKADALSNGLCSLGFTMSEKFGQTNQLIMAEAQKTRDLIQQNKIETLQGRISQLELQQAMCGVVRYPSGYTYTAGNNPFCGGCCQGTTTML